MDSRFIEENILKYENTEDLGFISFISSKLNRVSDQFLTDTNLS